MPGLRYRHPGSTSMPFTTLPRDAKVTRYDIIILPSMVLFFRTDDSNRSLEAVTF